MMPGLVAIDHRQYVIDRGSRGGVVLADLRPPHSLQLFDTSLHHGRLQGDGLLPMPREGSTPAHD